MKTFHIHIKGIVQGVGFRPFIYLLCTSHKVKGWVNNTSDGVHIHINSTTEKAKQMLNEIIENAPKLSKITESYIEEINFIKYSDFRINHTDSSKNLNLLITPDFYMCKDCATDLYSKEDRRYHYPFVTCTNCGPRYSITKYLPYDRETTTMDTIIMCPNCKQEYENPLDRRYYSQTNSCPNCTIELSLFEKGQIHKNFKDIDYITEQWKRGKIIAIKGIGGYLLTCDATNKNVIRRLRKLKNRPTKPFALMYHDFYELTEDVEMGIGEQLELENPSAPIVLLNVKKDRLTPIEMDEIAPKLNSIGVMLPYTPLYRLLLDRFKKPIVATSGNMSNSTIIFQDKKAFDELASISDMIVLNNREIVVPQDDSVIRYSAIKSNRIVLRRSRGLAPSYINPNLKVPNISILAMGAMLKSTFTLLNSENIYISQYLGNTDSLEAEENYKYSLSHFLKLFSPRLMVIVTDKHPNYFSTSFGKEIASQRKLKIIEVQHHKAHFFAVLGENDLFRYKENILGVIWDGAGIGDDGNIWGGEFFTYLKGKVKRVDHLDEFPFILGDKMSKEPRISALAITSNLKDTTIIKEKFSNTEWSIYQKLIKTTPLKSTSIGRLFDAAASIILGIDKQSYEGEAAMWLENAAYRYFRENNFTKYYSYFKNDIVPENFTRNILASIIEDINKGFKEDFIAAKFHISLAHYISIVAKKYKVKKVAFSGGVFQNQWLVELIISFMDDDFDLYFHKELSPNDENISFGQLMYYLYHKE